MANIVRLGGGSGGGGAKIGVTLNDDGTQNLFITETGDLPDLAAITADADAEAEDVLYGKTFYAMGVKKVGSFNMKPTLLWENASPTSDFAEQTVNVDSGYDGYLIETAYTKSNLEKLGINYFGVGATNVYTSAFYSVSNIGVRKITSVNDGGIEFERGYSSSTAQDSRGIPTRIWGVNFTL